MGDPHMRIGEVARRAGVRVSLLRYYEDIGLLPTAERVSGQRRYDESILRRLAVIDVARRAGLSLIEVRELIEHGRPPGLSRIDTHELLEHGSRPLGEPLRALAERRLPEIGALIDRAQRVRLW